MDVVLIDYAKDPLAKLYGAFRTCYTKLTPREVWEKIGAQEISPTDIQKFVQERLGAGHVSPLEQVVFWFGISGVSRALSHQLVRHRIGISFEQQSQRYVQYKEGALDFVTPKSIASNLVCRVEYEHLMKEIAASYQFFVDRGIPAEDARFVLPNATPTNFQIMVNFAELLHIGDLRLCQRAQWEIRQLVGKMRAEVRKVAPELAAVMQPKCGEHRMGFCDEDPKSYNACPLAKVVPHKSALMELWSKRSLTEADIQPEGT